MEGRGSEGGQLSSANPAAKPAGTLALRNFTIPRKKRASGQVLLEPCPEESRDYSLIQSKLKEARLDMRKEHANAWLWKDVNLVHNEAFLKEFSEKRSEMRTKGRHGREMEERYCFLVASYETTTQIYRHGLRTETQQQYSLGKPSHGVYLFRHVDVALKHAATGSLTAKNLIVFKVLFGKVKKVTPTSDWNRTPDPMVTFDCHMSKDAVSHRESLSQQVLGSSVFLFDYNDNQELNSRPRQCLPYALVSFVSAISSTPPTSISPPVSPVKHPTSLSHGPLDHLRGCTVAKRRGKGENATVTFKHFSTPMQTGCPGPEYTSPTPSTETTTPPFQQYSQQSPLHFIPQQLYMPLYHTAGYSSPSLPYMDNSIPFQNYPNQSVFPSNGLLNTLSIYGSNTSNGGVTTQTLTEKISTVVYSSRLVKDPRLSRQGSNPEQKSSEQDKANSSSETDNLRCQVLTQDGEDKNKSTGIVSCNKHLLEIGEEQNQDCHLKPSQEPESSPEPKTENMPSIKLFKMKFQKYATYLKMTEDERQKSIWSQQNMTPEQKQLLIERINFYDTYYQKYKQGLLFEKDTETENVVSLSNMEPKNSKAQQSHTSTLNESPLITQDSTENLSQTRQSDVSYVSTDLENTERHTVDPIKNTEGAESTKTTKEMKKKEQDPPPELQENVVQSTLEEPSISLEASLDQDPLSLKKSTSENIEAVESFAEAHPQQPSSPSTCILEQGNKVNTLQAAIKSLPQSPTTATTQSTLIITNNTEENPELEFHIRDTDVAHCVDISVLDDVSENNDLSTATAGSSDQDHSKSSTKNTSSGCLKYSKPEDSSEMSIEVKREELQQDNTIHSALYHRLQLDQLLPNLCGTGAFPYKSYLRPKDLVTTPSIDQLHGHLQEMAPKEGFNKARMQNWKKSGEDLQLTLMTMFQQVSARTERLSLSERFSKLRMLHNNKKKQILVHGRTKSTNNDRGHPITGVVKSHPECLQLSRHSDIEEKGSGSDNVKLIQLFAKRFNEARSLSSCRQLRRKGSKMLRKRNKQNLSVSSSNHSAQSNHQRALHILKRHFARRPNTKLSANGISQGPIVLCPKSTSLNQLVPSTSQSSDPQSHQIHDKSCDNKPTQEVEKAHLLTDHSCEDTPISDSKSVSQHEGVRHITPHQSTEDCQSNANPKKAQGDILLYVKHTVTVDEVEQQERGTKDNDICPHEESVPVTCCESTKDGGIAKAEPTEEATPQKQSFLNATQVETDMYGTKEISTNYNAGACRDQSYPVQAVSGVLSIPSSGNTINSCTAKAKPKTVMTPDLPEFVNMTDTEAKTKRMLYDNAVDSTGSGGIKSVVDLTVSGETGETSGEMDSNITILSSDLCSLGTLTFARENNLFERDQTLEVNQSSLKALKSPNNNPSLVIHPNEMRVSSSQQSTNANSGTINSHLKTYRADLLDSIVKDTREPVVVVPGNLHPPWQVQENKTTVPSTSTETQLISKLRDYLTKFEITVKKQESVNDTVKDAQEVPMAWITLDSTVHKQQLFDTRHYNRLDLANLQHPGKDCTLNYMLPSTTNEQATGKVIVINEAATSSVTPTKRKISKGRRQPKRMQRRKLARVSPDSTSMLEPDQHPANSQSHLVVDKDTTDQPQVISTSVPNQQQLNQNHGTPEQQNLILFSQSLENLNGPSSQPIASQGPQLVDVAAKLNEHSPNGKKDKNPYNQKHYSVTDISITLKLADHAVSVVDLCSLQLKCKSLLHYFISNFERDQKVPFMQSCISRTLILDKYLDHPPEPVELKFEALNSFLELQMMVEAYQFVENKINFLSRKATFRSLLWYDPSLYGELYKGAVGFQQQSSLFSSFQQCIASEGYRKLQEYYTAVATLHQQLQDAPDTSYYMYLKSKRERLEIEAALRNPPDIKSFFLSVPVALMMNFGDTLKSLEKSHRMVMNFVETPSDRLPGVFDVGKAEHLSIICRYLQEKVIFMKSKEQISKVSWFGLEHLLYDASKLLVWRESEHGMSNEVLLQYKRSNPQIVYGVTEAGVALVNKIEQHPAQPKERARITPEQQMDDSKNYSNTLSEISPEETHSVQENQTEDSMKERKQHVRRRATHPPLRRNLNDDGLSLLNPVQPNLPAQLGQPTPLPAFSQQSNAVHWRMAGPHAWDWNSPGVGQTSKSTPEIRALLMSKRRVTVPCTDPGADLRTNPASTWPPPYNINPRSAERITLHHQPKIGAPHHAELRKEQSSEATVPLIKPIPLQCLPPDTSSIVPPPVPHLPFPNTSNQLPPHEIAMPINYPYFLFNGKTYSAVTPSVPVPGPSLHNETQYHHPHPV